MILFMDLIKPEAFEQFYRPLVGDDRALSELKVGLAEQVNSSSDLDPYSRLQAGVVAQIDQAAYAISGIDLKQKMDILDNGENAMQETVDVLRTVGDIYCDQASVPQDIAIVTRNTTKALLHLYGLAYFDRGTAFNNMASYFRGNNPRNPFTQYFAQQWFVSQVIRGSIHMRAQTFTIEKDAAGQLDIKPRFKRSPPPDTNTSQKCPSTEARVGTPNKQRSALWTLMGAVGEVAIKEIFPHYFPMVGDIDS
jgi:hypothetical protein